MKKTYIIAEAGVNHNGDLEIAKKLVDMAVEFGADAVKFQTFKAYESTSKLAEKASYQKKNMPIEESQYEMLKKFELPFKSFEILKNYCEYRGIQFLSTPDGLESLEFLIGLGVDSIKVGSTEVTNHSFLKKISQSGKHIILSTGMSTLGEVESALEAIYSEGNTDIELMHCTTSYPTSIDEVNLNAMVTMREAFKIPVGFSDHTLGFESSVAAVSLGACTIEKHITLSRELKGPDHKASMPPEEFKRYVKYIRDTEKLLGTGIKKPTTSELRIMKETRRSIVAAADLKKGVILKLSDLNFKRPGYGIKPEMVHLIIGRELQIDLLEDEIVTWDHI